MRSPKTLTTAGKREPPTQPTQEALRPQGRLIVNADDWGCDIYTTDRTLDCVRRGTVSAVSGMVFMADSHRAAAIAREFSVDTGLHLNFTTPFTAGECPAALVDRQCRITAYLRSHRLAQLVFNPVLAHAFEYVAAAQVDEYRRLYGADPVRLDGHHHMHLCANVLLQRLLPTGATVRRNFSFQPGEKGIVNRAYRKLVDGILARRHRLADFLFNLTPTEPRSRIQAIVALARHNVVELETHPAKEDEYRFLTHADNIQLVGGWRSSASA